MPVLRHRVVNEQIVDDAITADKIAAGAVGTSEIATGGVVTADLADDAVTQDKMSPASVGTPSQRLPGYGVAVLPNANRPTLVVAFFSIECDKGEEGEVRLLIEDANPPTVITDIAYLKFTDANISASETVIGGKVVGVVPAGWRYLLDDVTLTGVPTFGVATVFEYTL